MNPEIVSFQYATGMCLLLENVGGCVHAGRPKVVTLNICNWPVLFRATHLFGNAVMVTSHFPQPVPFLLFSQSSTGSFLTILSGQCICRPKYVCSWKRLILHKGFFLNLKKFSLQIHRHRHHHHRHNLFLFFFFNSRTTKTGQLTGIKLCMHMAKQRRILKSLDF